jgi:hypothetical protein
MFLFCICLCEVTFDPDSKLKEIHEPLECVRIPAGFTVGYHWPNDCLIEYYDGAV